MSLFHHSIWLTCSADNYVSYEIWQAVSQTFNILRTIVVPSSMSQVHSSGCTLGSKFYKMMKIVNNSFVSSNTFALLPICKEPHRWPEAFLLYQLLSPSRYEFKLIMLIEFDGIPVVRYPLLPLLTWAFRILLTEHEPIFFFIY